MVDSEFAELARQLDAKLTEGSAPSSLKQLLSRSGHARRSTPRVRPAAILVLGIALGAVAGASLMERDAPGESLAQAPAIDAAATEPDCARPMADGVLELSAACTWRSVSPALEVVSMSTSQLRVEADALTLLSGWVVFDVDPVLEGSPVRIRVSEGTIEVLGTRFSVYQDPSRGHVELVEGRIRWTGRDGVGTVLDPGDRFAWGVPSRSLSDVHVDAEPAADESAEEGRGGRSETPARAAAPEPPKSIDDIGRLRSKGRYLEALALARKLARKSRDPRTREVLHYEAGTLIEGPLGDVAAACEHWREHLERFPGGRYVESVSHRLAKLECDAVGP